MEILNWLESSGFQKTKRTWSQPDKDGLMFYDFNKNNLNVEICLNWNKTYSFYPEIRINFLDYTDAFYSTFEAGYNYQGYLGGKHLGCYDKFSKSLFDELVKFHLK